MTAKTKLLWGLGLLAASMLPLLAFYTGRLETAPLELWLIAWATVILAAWATRGGKVLWVLSVLRALAQVGIMLVAVFALISSGGSDRLPLLLQVILSLGSALPALLFLVRRDVIRMIFSLRPPAALKLPEEPPPPPGEVPDGSPAGPRQPSVLANREVLRGVLVVALLSGGIEQWLVWQHFSLVEWLLRALVVALPVCGALAGARLGRDRLGLVAGGAILGDLAGEQIGMLASTTDAETMILHVLMPLTSLPAIFIGLAPGWLGTRRWGWQVVAGMALAQVAYREGSSALAGVAGRGAWPDLVFLATGAAFGAVVWRWRRPAGTAAPGMP